MVHYFAALQNCQQFEADFLSNPKPLSFSSRIFLFCFWESWKNDSRILRTSIIQVGNTSLSVMHAEKGKKGKKQSSKRRLGRTAEAVVNDPLTWPRVLSSFIFLSLPFHSAVACWRRPGFTLRYRIQKKAIF